MSAPIHQQTRTDVSWGGGPSTTQAGRVPYRSKRALDLTVAFAVLLVTTPLFAFVIVSLLIDSGPPLFFRARRLGLGGRPFTMYKFRTMVRDAEALLEDFAERNVGDGMVKLVDDPRVTRVGAWLRRFSVDELPQLWNVLRGEMSIVGPRPHDAAEILADAPEHIERLYVPPGLTGLWQIRARSDPSLSSRVYWDLRYVASCSLSLDLKIMAETVPVVISGLGGRVEASDSRGPQAVAPALGHVPPTNISAGESR